MNKEKHRHEAHHWVGGLQNNSRYDQFFIHQKIFAN